MAIPPNKLEQELKLTQEQADEQRERSELIIRQALAILETAYASNRQVRQDAAIARALQEEGLQANRPHRLVQHLTPQQIASARTQLNLILSHDSVRGTPSVLVLQPDAHAHTRTFIRNNLRVLREIDDLLRAGQPTTHLTPDQVLAELKDYYSNDLSQVGGPNIEDTFRRLAAGITQNNNSPVDGETLQNVPELLSRVWTLAKAYDPVNSIVKVVSILRDNTADAGGCLAGLVARLFACQATLLSHIVPGQIRLTPPPPAPRPNAPRPPVPVVRQATTTPQITPVVAQATVIPPVITTPQATPVIPPVAMAMPQATPVRPTPRPAPRAPLTPAQIAQRAVNLARAAEYDRQRQRP